MVQMSQQNLIDCSTAEGNHGCDGGSMENAFLYVQTHGIESLDAYPDVSNVTGLSDQPCVFDASLSVSLIASWGDIDSGSESALQQAVALVGPVSAAIDARSREFRNYGGGVYSISSCGSSINSLNHAILVVGYGVYNNQPYWLIQNSWGTGWGINGYMMVARNSNNMCGVATYALFPVISLQSSTATPNIIKDASCESDSSSSTGTTIHNSSSDISISNTTPGVSVITTASFDSYSPSTENTETTNTKKNTGNGEAISTTAPGASRMVTGPYSSFTNTGGTITEDSNNNGKSSPTTAPGASIKVTYPYSSLTNTHWTNTEESNSNGISYSTTVPGASTTEIERFLSTTANGGSSAISDAASAACTFRVQVPVFATFTMLLGVIIRQRIWMHNVHKINGHNELAAQGKYNFTLGVNPFTDMTESEYRKMLGHRPVKLRADSDETLSFIKVPVYPRTGNGSSLPSHKDWSESDVPYIGPVVSQGKSSSCYAYAAIGAMEAQYAVNTGKFVALSQQNIIDCSQQFGNEGCRGGSPIASFCYVQSKGIESLESYPDESDLTGKDGKCQFDKEKSVMNLKSLWLVTQRDEAALKQAVVLIGPVAVAIYAALPSFSLYDDGVYEDPDCQNHEPDHAVLVVGYGEDENGQPYWLIKNSWGTDWGISGYMRLARNRDNMCGVATQAVFPIPVGSHLDLPPDPHYVTFEYTPYSPSTASLVNDRQKMSHVGRCVVAVTTTVMLLKLTSTNYESVQGSASGYK